MMDTKYKKDLELMPELPDSLLDCFESLKQTVEGNEVAAERARLEHACARRMLRDEASGQQTLFGEED